MDITKQISKIEVSKGEVSKGDLTKRPSVLTGSTIKLQSKFIDEAVYITINSYQDKPFEVFINTKNQECQPWLITVSRLISGIWRNTLSYGGSSDFIYEELTTISDPGGWVTLGAKKVPSLVAEIGIILKQHLKKDTVKPTKTSRLRLCPECGEIAVHRVEGCETCTQCGYSKC